MLLIMNKVIRFIAVTPRQFQTLRQNQQKLRFKTNVKEHVIFCIRTIFKISAIIFVIFPRLI